MATKIIKEIDLYDSKYHLKIGILFCIFLVFIFNLYKNIHNNESIPFEDAFNYVEGINNNTEDTKKLYYCCENIILHFLEYCCCENMILHVLNIF